MPTWDDVVAIGTALPAVTVSTSYRTPSPKVRDKSFARLRTEAEGGLVLMAAIEEKEALLASGDPAFYTTPHYDGHGAVLVNLDLVEVDHLRELIVEVCPQSASHKEEPHRDTHGPAGPGVALQAIRTKAAIFHLPRTRRRQRHSARRARTVDDRG